ncbi:MAG: anaerobic ribonucleoside-triphosphate reductase activating protein [Faecousia sp.]
MNYAAIKPVDIANGPGVRVSLFVSGCTHHCKGCFQPETWNFDYGQPFTSQTQEEILGYLAPDYVQGLTLLGGEPMEPQNQAGLLPLLRAVKTRLPEKSIWCFTGYTLDKDILPGKLGDWAVTQELLSYLDVLVDGEFVEALKNLSLRFRGSSNQRLIDVPKTLAAGEIVLWQDWQTEKGK